MAEYQVKPEGINRPIGFDNMSSNEARHKLSQY
jgi:hypothetical protein